eukprot:7543544-Pyramimonas_sp.AAC.1
MAVAALVQGVQSNVDRRPRPRRLSGASSAVAMRADNAAWISQDAGAMKTLLKAIEEESAQNGLRLNET